MSVKPSALRAIRARSWSIAHGTDPRSSTR